MFVYDASGGYGVGPLVGVSIALEWSGWAAARVGSGQVTVFASCRMGHYMLY